MQAVILAGGKGTRMRPLTDMMPKPLVPFRGRPLIEHVFERLPAEVDEVVVVVKYRGEQLRAHVGDVFAGKRVRYVEQGLPDGTGGALCAAREILDERFLVLNADDLHERAALTRLLAHRYGLLAATSETPERYGVLVLREDGTLVGIDEKPDVPASNLVNTGAMMLDRAVFSCEAPIVTGELRLTDLVVALAAEHPVWVEVEEGWQSVGSPEDITQHVAALGGKK